MVLEVGIQVNRREFIKRSSPEIPRGVKTSFFNSGLGENPTKSKFYFNLV